MAIITIVGAGAMGSAFSVPCTDRGHQVRLVGTHLDVEYLTAMRSDLPHPRLGVTIPRTHLTIAATTELSAMVEGADLVVLGVNSRGIDWAIDALGRSLSRAVPLLVLTKGIHADGERLSILPDYLRRELSRRIDGDIPVLAIGGPSIARELAERRDTSVILAGTDAELARSIAAELRAGYYHVQTDGDVTGVEVAAAFKNLYAIAVGICEGTGDLRSERTAGPVGFNPAAAVFAQAVREMSYLATRMGGRSDSVYGLAGTGDLYVTSRRGRNNRAGKLMAAGTSWKELRATTMKEDTIEGAELAIAIAPTIRTLIKRGFVERDRIPLLMFVIYVVVEGEAPVLPWSSFLG